MSAHDRVADVIEIILAAVALEAGKEQDQLSVDVESVITRGILESFKRGGDYVHERPTDPPPRPKTPAPFPAVHPPRNKGTPPQPFRKGTPPQPFRKGTPAPFRKIKRKGDD